MRVAIRFLLPGACAVAVVVAALAVQAQNTKVDVDRNGVRGETGPKNTQTGDLEAAKSVILRSRDILGLRVYNSNDESLGKIEDMVIDSHSGKIRYAVLSFGGVLGMGNKFFAVPWPKLSFVSKGTTSAGTQKESYCVLDVSKTALKNAPGFDKDNWPDFADANWNATILKFYGGGRHQASGPRNPQR